MSAIPSAMQVMHLKNFYLQWLLSTQQEDKDVQPGVRKKKNTKTCNLWVSKGRQGVLYPGYTAISVNFLWFG
jgi:hypothetical protein